MPSTIGRRVVVPLTNRSGGSVAAGDVVVIGDGSNDECFTTTTTASFTARNVGIAQETIASLATGRVLVRGYAALVNVNASVSRDHFLFTHTVAKQATGSATRAQGAFGQILKTSATPSALIWGDPDQTSAAGLGAWTDYTPTLTGSVSNPSVGNGTIDGRYKLLDSTTGIVQVRFQYGSTSTAGSGDWIFSLPSGWVVASNVAYQTGSAHLLDAGTKHMPGTVKFAAGESTTDEIIYGLAVGNGIVSNTQPFTWANGDQLNFSALLELSSS